jgi:hypothetical protein
MAGLRRLRIRWLRRRLARAEYLQHELHREARDERMLARAIAEKIAELEAEQSGVAVTVYAAPLDL